MSKYGFTLTRIFQCKDRIVDEDRDNLWKESELYNFIILPSYVAVFIGFVTEPMYS